MSRAAEEAVAALEKLMGHFAVKTEDAPDVQAYKGAMLEGFSQLGSDMQSLNGLAEGDNNDKSGQ